MTQHLYATLPRFLLIVGGGIALNLLTLMLVVLLGLDFLLPFIMLWIVILGYYTFVTLWAPYLAYDVGKTEIQQALVSEGQVRPTDTIVYLYVRDLRFVDLFIKRLSIGQLTLIDIYSPQVMPGHMIQRWRLRNSKLKSDRRLEQSQGELSLLPLQANTADLIIMPHVIGAVGQRGDRAKLLDEAYRLLKPNGRLLIVTTPRTWISQLTFFRSAPNMLSSAKMDMLLKRHGYTQIEHYPINHFQMVMRAIKPNIYRSMQLPLNL